MSKCFLSLQVVRNEVFFCTFSQVGNMQEAPSQFHLSSVLPSPQPLYQPTVYTAATCNVNFPLGESLLTLLSAASGSVSARFLTDTHTPKVSEYPECICIF